MYFFLSFKTIFFPQIREDWKYVAMVIDRLQLYIFFLVTAAGTVGILLDAPHIFQYVDQDAVIEMHKGKATRWDKYGQVWACSFPPINGYYVASEQTTIILCSISAHFARLKIWSYMHRSLLVILKIKKETHSCLLVKGIRNQAIVLLFSNRSLCVSQVLCKHTNYKGHENACSSQDWRKGLHLYTKYWFSYYASDVFGCLWCSSQHFERESSYCKAWLNEI